jgi:hypothetical protein
MLAGRDIRPVNIFGLIAVGISVVAWLGGAIIWLVMVYHMVMLSIVAARHLGSKSLFSFNWPPWWFRSDLPDRLIIHRRRAIRGGIAFVACCFVGMVAATLGIWLGGWQSP